MIFLYKALKDNKQVTGKIDANNTEEAVSLLKAGGFFPIEVKKEGTGTSVIAEIFDRVDIDFAGYLLVIL
jgi:type II secretory pathway component PulF